MDELKETRVKIQFERISDLMTAPPVIKPSPAERAALWIMLIGVAVLLTANFYIFAGLK